MRLRKNKKYLYLVTWVTGKLEAILVVYLHTDSERRRWFRFSNGHECIIGLKAIKDHLKEDNALNRLRYQVVEQF